MHPIRAVTLRVSSSYRTDIDCLRGIAVLLVVAFHFGALRLTGGFIGVDIFFVISGFLITRIIYSESVAGNFSFVRFYERRMRRILPALYALVAVVAVVSLFYLLPNEYLQFSKSALSVVAFGSNVLFWQESGYFAEASHVKPLLHTWSLAVEEQFYFVFPVVIYALTRFDRRRELFWIAALALASFAFSVWGVRHYQEATFYLAPGRAWEFLLGSLLAVPGIPAPKGKVQQVSAVTAGLAMIFIPAFLLKSTTLFPGENALIPCLGTALIIWGNTGIEGQGPRNPLERLFAFFGAISYSLYLWHWPVLVFYRRILGTSPEYTRLTTYDRTALFAVSVALSYASYRLIEQPVRARIVGSTRRSLFGGVAVASLALVLIGGVGIVWNGFPERVDPKVLALANFSNYRFDEIYQRGGCFLSQRQTFSDLKSECLRIEPGGKNILVWGDSVAAHNVHGFRELAPRFGLNISHATSSACPPAYGVELAGLINCRAFNDGVRAFIETKRPDAVVLSAVWNVTVAQRGAATIWGPLRETIASIAKQGVRVFLMGPPIQYVDRLPYILSQYALTGLDRLDSRKFMDRKVFEFDAQMSRDFGGMEGVRFISVLNTVCEQRKCPMLVNGIPMQWDWHHLTAEGSILEAERLLPEIVKGLDGRR